ncbi:MAG: peptidoglycan editing factor PgeF [Bacteroidales bacterium]|nr:peptidoglycan editing factor PgeF [Bacteroidales bacterium]
MIELLQFRQFESLRGIGHFITTRYGGRSEGTFESLNLSMKAGDDVNRVAENRILLAEEIGLNPRQMHFPDQCHTNHIKIIESRFDIPDLKETDGVITHQKGICLCVLAADCVPILLYDSVKQVVAAVHSGWRGTAGSIIIKAIEQMTGEYGSKPERIMAGIGPAISAPNYEVGGEVVQKLESLFGKNEQVISFNGRAGKAHVDLKEANRLLLLEAGLKPGRIEVMDDCTFSKPEYFFSARRDGYHTGRFAAGIFLKE